MFTNDKASRMIAIAEKYRDMEPAVIGRHGSGGYGKDKFEQFIAELKELSQYIAGPKPKDAA